MVTIDGSGLGLALLIAMFWIFSVLVLGIMLLFIGLRKKSKSTILAFSLGIIGAIIGAGIGFPLLGLIVLVLGFLIGLFIFKGKDFFKGLRGKGFGVAVRVISAIGTSIAVILLATLFTQFLEIAPNEIKLLLIAISIPLVTLIVGIAGIFWGSK